VSDLDCVAFLRWALPCLRLRWAGFRRVRRQVCKRVARRLGELGLADLDAYRAYLEAHPAEWRVLDTLCRVTISRFYRDARVFAFLERAVLPVLARRAVAEGRSLAAWSAGCASGEEPYTLALIWELALAPAFAGLELDILATDVDPVLLERAEAAVYEAGSLRDLPGSLLRGGFEVEDGRYRLRPGPARRVTLLRHDVRDGAPDGPFDLVCCRNLAFTYFELAAQEEVCATLAACLRPGGALVIGAHESLPESTGALVPWPGARAVYERTSPPTARAAAGRRLGGDRVSGSRR
jgi:chemotaxis protein methyltransferase CheR